MQIIPAIDIYRDRCVRLSRGDFASRVEYRADPYEVAKHYYEAGIHYLHLVDLEGAQNGRIVHWNWFERIRDLQGIFIQAGGGVRSESDVERLLAIGIDCVIVGSVAIDEPERFAAWVKNYGAEHFCAGLDIKNGSLATHGWQQSSTTGAGEMATRLIGVGVRRALATDVDRDGMLSGPNINLYEELVIKYPEIQWLASGGVRSVEDVHALKSIRLSGVILGKALYEGTINLEELVQEQC
jgi:phosphoribosylformimino-5-aminoimidazole carboxamide ribotide isomerase